MSEGSIGQLLYEISLGIILGQTHKFNAELYSRIPVANKLTQNVLDVFRKDVTGVEEGRRVTHFLLKHPPALSLLLAYLLNLFGFHQIDA